jgi:hypothetical protein
MFIYLDEIDLQKYIRSVGRKRRGTTVPQRSRGTATVARFQNAGARQPTIYLLHQHRLTLFRDCLLLFNTV